MAEFTMTFEDNNSAQFDFGFAPTSVGIIDAVLNADYTLTIIFSDGTSYTSPPIRGEQGERGSGITSAIMNPDYTMTFVFEDGYEYTTQPIRGEKGEKGDTGDTGATGNGIADMVLNDDYTLTTTFTNGDTYTSPSIRGATGRSPVITGSKSGDTTTIYSDGVSIGTIVDGATGEKGEDGHTPVISASKSGQVTTISVDGESVATINDGHTPSITASKNNGVTVINVEGTTIARINDGARGEDGHTPVITTTKTGKTNTIYADGVSVGTVLDGDDGHSPEITTSKSGSVTTILSDGVSIGTVSDGETGATGQAGHSPVVTASKSNGVTTVSVDGNAIATINDGQEGHSPTITTTKTEGVTTILSDGVSIGTVNDGENGESGVYIGTEEPTDEDILVWIDSDGTPNSTNGNIASTYSPSSTYSVGDYVVYNNALYVCTTDIPTAEIWTLSHWTQVTVGSELSDIRTNIDDLVIVSSDQPSSSDNKIWIDSDSIYVQIPTYEEFVSMSNNIAPDYSDLTFPVAAGTHCIYEDTYYEANQNISSSEEFTAAHWTQVNVSEVIEGLSIGSGLISDVQVNGESVVSNGVANIPVATASNYGVFREATGSDIKAGNSTRVITAKSQFRSVFYGLAEAAGDTTQSQSNNAVGTYTDEAKGKIQNMLGVSNQFAIVCNGTTASQNITEGQFVVWNGALYTASDDISSGDTLSNTNLTAVSNGGLNAIMSIIGDVESLLDAL